MTEKVMKENKQSLVLPSSKRKELLMKIDEFKTGDLNARNLSRYKKLTKELSIIFEKLCWNKFGISLEQLKRLTQQELDELAKMVYERSRTAALIQTGIWACIPFVGWLVLSSTLGSLNDYDHIVNINMRYYWWYRRTKNKFGKDFKPSIY